MKVHVLLSHLNADELYFTNRTTVVIDVLRATSVIAQALSSGAKEITPVGSVDFAMKISGDIKGGQTLLCGERNTKMVEGFNLGNSPLEYDDTVAGKTIILFTTNGSKAILKARYSENLFCCSFNNLSAVAKHISSLTDELTILCSGSNGMFSLEDTVCAGKLIKELTKYGKNINLSDAASASLVLSKNFGKDLLKLLSETEHGKLLIENGFEQDIEFCSRLSNLNIIPAFINGSIKLLQQDSDN